MSEQGKSLNDEVIDLEWCAKNGHKPPKGRKYRIKIDRDFFTVNKECLTGRELLLLAGKNPPERYQLNQKLRGGQVKRVNYDQEVCFTDPGIEKFMTLPLDQTEGESLKRDFALLEEDAAFLDSLNLPWEAITDHGKNWALIHKFPICDGYNVSCVILAICIAGGYPHAQLDMAYFYPMLSRRDGQSIGGLSIMNLNGRQFQRWSRHRTQNNPWRPGIDCLATHVRLVENWLEREFQKGGANG